MSKKVISVILALSVFVFAFFGVSAKIVQRGDLNGDGKYDAVDYILMRRLLLDQNDPVAATEADVNNDSNFNIKDIQTMAKYLIKEGELYSYEKPGWNTLFNWEGMQENKKPTGITANYASVKTKFLDNYSVANTKNLKSKVALSVLPNGLVDSTKEDSSKGSNPTTGEDPTSILTKGKLGSATNLRVSMNIINKLDRKYYSAYIGCKLKASKYDKNYDGYYFYPIEVVSYSDDFNYFYFVGKEFTKCEYGERFTYLEDAPTRVLQKEDVPNIQAICIWMEENRDNDSTVTPVSLMIDDIEYYDGKNGYDSIAEDNLLKKPTAEKPDGVKRYLAVAFDDGPRTYSKTGRYFMEYYMELAEKYNAHFTYFLNGNENRLNDSNGNPKESAVNLMKTAVNKGHELANHTWSHGRLSQQSDSGIIKEITDIDNWLFDNVGVKTSFVRFPFYDSNEYILRIIKNNIPNIKASIGGNCPIDYNNTSVDYRKWYYKKDIKDGTITLTHEHYIDNVEVINWMLEYYTNLGYEFVTISELFEIKGATPQLGSMYYTVS